LSLPLEILCELGRTVPMPVKIEIQVKTPLECGVAQDRHQVRHRRRSRLQLDALDTELALEHRLAAPAVQMSRQLESAAVEPTPEVADRRLVAAPPPVSVYFLAVEPGSGRHVDQLDLRVRDLNRDARGIAV